MVSKFYILCKLGKVLEIFFLPKFNRNCHIEEKKSDSHQPVILMLMLYVPFEILIRLIITINRL